MANASGAQTGLSYILEATAGITPATPVFKKMRVTGNDLLLNKDALLSDERRDDRQITDVRHGNRSVSGPIPFEFSASNFDDMIEAVLQGSWTADVLKAGVTQRHFTFERFHADISVWLRYLGCAISTMGLTVAPNQIVTGSFGVAGMDQETDTAIITGATYVEPGTEKPMDSFSGTITEGGTLIAYVTSLDLALDNGIEGDFAIGSDKPIELTSKRSNLTGTLVAFFRDSSLLSKFINETETSLSFVLSDGISSYTCLLPKIKYMGGSVPITDDGSLVLTLPFQALWDETEDTNIKITRA